VRQRRCGTLATSRAPRPERSLATNSLTCSGHDAERNLLLGKAGGAFDGVLHRTAFDETHDPPAVLRQMDRPSNRPIRRARFAVVRRFHQIKKFPWNRLVVNHCVRGAQRVHRERGEMTGIAIARSE
jgi:hypothetical protein